VRTQEQQRLAIAAVFDRMARKSRVRSTVYRSGTATVYHLQRFNHFSHRWEWWLVWFNTHLPLGEMTLGAIEPLIPSCRTEHTVSFWTLLKLKFSWDTRYLCGEAFPMYQAALTLTLDTSFNSLASLKGSMINFNIFLCEAKPILYYINIPYYQDEKWKLFKIFPTSKK